MRYDSNYRLRSVVTTEAGAVPSTKSIMRYDSNHRLTSVVTTEAEIALVDIALKQNPWESWTVLSVFSTPESVTVKRRHAVVGAGSAIYYRDIFAPVNPMATFFLPGGKAVCAWSAEDGLRVQDTFTGKKLAADDSTAPPKVAAILRGGKVVAVLWPSRDPLSVNIGAEDSVALIETDSRKVLRTIEAAPREGTVGYRSVAFSPDGKRAAVIGHSGRDQTHIRIVDCSTGRTVKEFLALHETRKTEFDVRSNENAVEVLTPDEVRESEFDGRSFERAPEAREPTVVRGAFSPNGRRLAIEIEGEIRIWNVETAEEVSANPGPARPQDRSVEEHQGTVYALVFSPDAAMLATLSNDATTRLWDTRSGKELFRWAHKLKWSMADSVAFSPDSKTLAIDLGGGRIEIRRCSDGTCLHRLDEPLDNGKTLNHTGPSAVAFSPDGRQLAVWPCSDRTLIWWDAQSGRRLGETHVVTSENDRPISTVYRSASTTVLSPGLRWIGSLEYLKHSLLVWDSQTGRRQYRLTQEGPFGSHRFSPDGRLLAFGMQGGNIRIVDVTSAQTVREFECDAEQSFPRTFLDDGRILVSIHDDRTTRFWDVVGGREIFRLDGIRIRACSRDGRYAASVAKPDYIRRREGTQVFSRISIWDLRLAKSKSEEQ